MVSVREQPQSTYGRNLQICFWILLVSLTTYFSINSLPLKDAVLRNVLVTACHAINFYACYSFLMPRLFDQKRYVTALGGLLLLYLLLTPVRYFIEQRFTGAASSHAGFGLFGLMGFVIFTQLVITKSALLLRIAVNHELNRERIILIQKAQLDAELKFLKAQMNPDFLFNTVNNIYSLTLIKSERAPEALMRLSGLLRYLLYESPDKVALTSELAALQNYAELFQMKYEEPLNLVINIEIKSKDESWVEPHLLIPILENTLKHSGLGADEKAFAVFSILEDEKNIWVEVENSRVNGTSSVPDPSGIALTNVAKRLELLYPDRHTLKIQEDHDRFSVTMIIPRQ